MIKSNKGLLTVSGKVDEIKADFASIVHDLRYTMNLSSEEILATVNLGLLSEEELDYMISELDNTVSMLRE